MTTDELETTMAHILEAALRFEFGGIWRVSIKRSSVTGGSIGSITRVHENGGWSSIQFAIPMGTSLGGADVTNLFLAKAAEIIQ